jgi:amidase
VPVSDLLAGSASQVVELLRRREVSSRELTERVLERIDRLNPRLNAVVEVRAEAALKDADVSDGAITAGSRGPLLGVPMTVKEALDVTGMRTTWGNPAFKDYVADTDAMVVRRLRNAGAVIVGKTNVAAMLGDFAQTANDVYGVTNNPWDTDRTPGGSSGGAAAATAAGMAFVEYGSDLVGSIRIPASFCGVYGLRPSVGIVPLTGFQPPGPPAIPNDMTYLPALGPLGRSAADLRVALTATAGPEGAAANAYTWRLAAARHSRLDEFRVGVVLDSSQAPVTSEVGAALSDAVDALARSGVDIVEGWPQGVDPAEVADSFGFHLGLFFAYQQAEQATGTLATSLEHEHRRMAIRAAWDRYFTHVDAFLCPTNFTAAFPHDRRPFEQRTVPTSQGEQPYSNQPFWTSQASLPGLPALTAPIGTTADGIPVGAQIIGPLYEDDTPLTFAELLADEIGGYQRPPGLQ